jgi:hypothetical protein
MRCSTRAMVWSEALVSDVTPDSSPVRLRISAYRASRSPSVSSSGTSFGLGVHEAHYLPTYFWLRVISMPCLKSAV